MATAAVPNTIGKIIQVIGPVIDVEFETGNLPELYNALTIKAVAPSGQSISVVVEVQQHIGRNQVRTVAMSSTDGVTRGMEVVDTGAAIAVPVGAPALGRILNVLGEPVDDGAPIPADALRWPIHRKRPDFVNLEPKTEVFETGIKVVDLVAPFVKGGKIGLFGGAGVGKTVIIQDPGAVLPGGIHIGARKTYGHISNGMICSAQEVGIGEEHTEFAFLKDSSVCHTDFFLGSGIV